MKAEEFVRKINLLTPEKSTLESLGLSDNFIKEVLSEFYIRPNGREAIYNNELLDLVSCYDVASLKVGTISFNQNLTENSEYFYFGEDEADMLILDKTTKEIKVLDHEDQQTVISYCAVDSDSFLNILYELKKFLTDCAFNKVDDCEQEEKCTKALDLGNWAGGEKYINFYKGLLGCWS